MSINFDATHYLTLYPDVLAAVARGEFASAAQHFDLFGWQEGRSPNPNFDVSYYLTENPDVLAAGVNPLTHFLQYGALEGRTPSADFPAAANFDTAAYFTANPDLGLAGVDTPAELYAHFVTFGFAESRPGVQTLDGSPILVGPLNLTVFDDNLTGNDGGNVFTAPIAQDQAGLGQPANTLGNNDVLDGAGGTDQLRADLGGFITTTSPTTTNIEQVYFRAQFPSLLGNNIDAEKMDGVEQWWTQGSRSGVSIEDIRSDAADTTFGMRDTDANVGLNAFFNATFVAGADDAVGVVLDGVGNGAQGGNLNIGALAGNSGVEIFNVNVDGDSHVSSMDSFNQNGVPGVPNEYLQTVNLVSIGELGDLTVGTLSGNEDGRVNANGLTNVREVNGEGFAGALNLGISLDGNTIDRYLDEATGPVQFNYVTGEFDDLLNVQVNGAVSSDVDFALNVDVAGGDDRLIISVPTARNVTVEGGLGVNSIVVSQSHGTNANNTFETFANFQTYEIEGFNDTAHNFATMGGIQTVVVATGEFGDDTQLINLEAAQNVTVSGKNQTIGTASNNSQEFGEIRLTNDAGATRVLTLENTARVDASLRVNAITIDQDGGTSATRTLDVVSSGARDVANFVNAVNAARLTTLNMTGTQDLSLHVATMATLPVTGGNTPPLTVSGTALTGDLVLAMNSAMLDRGSADVLRGTAGTEDTLQLYGVDPGAATVSGFETVQFGGPFPATFLGFRGTYNADNTTGVSLYDFVNLDAATTVSNLSGVVTAEVGVDAEEDLTFIGESEAAGNTLDITFGDEDTGDFYNATLTTDNFRTVNVTLAGEEGSFDFFFFDIATDNYARTLSFSGGNAEEGFDDVLQLGAPLANSLTTINFSNFEGDIGSVTLNAAAVPADQSNTVIVLNGYGAVITDNVTDQITTFVLTEDAVSVADDLSITGFRAFNDGSTDLTNLSILDVRALDVDGLVDITITAAGFDTIITSNEGLDFEILLVGVSSLDLSNENFAFA